MRSALEWKNPRSGRADQGRPGVVGPVGRVRDGMDEYPSATDAGLVAFPLDGGRSLTVLPVRPPPNSAAVTPDQASQAWSRRQ